MIDYSKMTTAELVNELNKLELGLEMDMMMDGSGELGGIISKGYDKYFNAIYEEFVQMIYQLLKKIENL